MALNEMTPTNLNKMSLADQLAARTGMARSIAYEAVETVFDLIANNVAQGKTVSITNFGSWSRADKRARTARNPHTGGVVEVPERKSIKFSVSPRLVGFANSSDPASTTIRKLPKGPSEK